MMSLRLHTVSKELTTYLQRLMESAAFSQFYLAGGTALALQLGHRESIDIDLFTNIEYGTMNLEEMRRSLAEMFPVCENLESLNNRQMVYTVYIGDTPNRLVKLDLCYDEQPIFSIMQDGVVRYASDREIAAMKLLAIVTGDRPKDFWDLHALKKDYSLEDMIGWAIKRNPYTLTVSDILDAFNKVLDFPEPEDIISLTNDRWPFIADELFEAAKKLKESEQFLRSFEE